VLRAEVMGAVAESVLVPGDAGATPEGLRSPQPPRDARFAMWLALTAAVSVAVTMSWFVTRDELWIHRDSGVYAGVAFNLSHDRGATVPFQTQMYPPDDMAADLARLPELPSVLYPPGYPLLLAGTTEFGFDVNDAARAVNVVAIGAIVLAVAAYVRRGVPTSRWAPAITGVTAGVLPTVQALGAQFMSDLVSVATLLWGLVALDALLQREPPRVRYHLPFWILSVAAVMTRHVGIALVLTAIVVVLARRRSVWRAAVVAAPAALAAAAWHLSLDADGGERIVSVHIRFGDAVDEFAQTVGDWFASPAADWWIRILLAAAAAAVVIAVRTRRERITPRVTRRRCRIIAASFASSYVSVVLFSKFFVGDGIPLNPRMLAPLLCLAVAHTAVEVASIERSSRTRGSLLLAVAALIAVVVAPWRTDGAWAYVGRASSIDALANGVEPAPAPPLLLAAAALPDSVLVVTNAPERLWLAAERSSLSLPLRYDGNRGAPNKRFADLIDQLVQIARERPLAFAVVNDRRTADLLLDELPVCDRALHEGGMLILTAPRCTDASG
jgi:hypothetical protein